MAIIGTAIGETAKTYERLLAARIIQGFCISAFESLIVASVGLVPHVNVLTLLGTCILFTSEVSESPL